MPCSLTEKPATILSGNIDEFTQHTLVGPPELVNCFRTGTTKLPCLDAGTKSGPARFSVAANQRVIVDILMESKG